MLGFAVYSYLHIQIKKFKLRFKFRTIKKIINKTLILCSNSFFLVLFFALIVIIICSQVEFAAERIRMELIEAAKSGAAGAAAWGKMDFHCREPRASDPITFTTRDSHLVSICSSYLQWYVMSLLIYAHSCRNVNYLLKGKARLYLLKEFFLF